MINIAQTASNIEKMREMLDESPDISLIIRLSAAGSDMLAISLKTTEVASRFKRGEADNDKRAIIPVIPTLFLISDMLKRTDSADSAKTPPTIGMKLAIAYFTVFEIAPA